MITADQYIVKYQSLSIPIDTLITEMLEQNCKLVKVSIVIKDGIQQNELLFKQSLPEKKILHD